MFIGFEATVANVIKELGLVPGLSVQTYQEPLVRSQVQKAFDFIFRKRFWKHLTKTTLHTLDGSSGVVIDDIVGLKSYQDIEWVRLDPFKKWDTLEIMDDDDIEDQLVKGYAPIDWEDAQYEDKVIRIYPKTTVGDIKIRARRKPDPFSGDEIVPFESDAIELLTIANILAADGMNPGQQERAERMFDQVYQDIVINDSNYTLTYGRRDVETFTVAGT